MFADDLQKYGPDSSSRGLPPTLLQSRRYCRRLARRHYENFTVASRLLPGRLRQDFANIYAYCRWADDLADEPGDARRSIALLDWWAAQLRECYAGRASHPVFVALADTIERFALPPEPFEDLLDAFRQDQEVARYETIEQLLDYCRRSANPVGRLVLRLGRSATPDRVRLADSICTGLQLANFCQDVAEDWDRGRVYLPQDDCRRFGYDETMFARRECNDSFRRLLAANVDRAEEFLRAGEPLADQMPDGLRLPVALFAAGGLAILKGIRRANFDVWSHRPTVSGDEKLRLAIGCWRRSRRGALSPQISAIAASYRFCRQMSRRAGSSFHAGFMLLPADRRRAMWALYAFMRHTDDLADGPTGKCAPRDALAAWRSALEQALTATSDERRLSEGPLSLLPALADTIRRFKIPPEHLHAVIDGVEMDLDGRRYETFGQLRCYCERVASAVGLACIHIWGFRGREAFEPARAAGVALQLTNILRDLREDAAVGRLYLPQDDLRRCGYSFDDLRAGTADRRFHRLIAFEVDRAERLYDEAAELLDLLEPAGRRMYGVTVATYRALLRKIAADPARALSRRTRLGRREKLGIVARWALLPPRKARLL